MSTKATKITNSILWCLFSFLAAFMTTSNISAEKKSCGAIDNVPETGTASCGALSGSDTPECSGTKKCGFAGGKTTTAMPVVQTDCICR